MPAAASKPGRSTTAGSRARSGERISTGGRGPNVKERDLPKGTTQVKRKPVDERFWAQVQWAEADDCWNWLATRDRDGYGRLKIDGRTRVAHRWAYEALVAEIPPGLMIDHLCRNRSCVNPFHMEPVTNRVNVMRGASVTGNSIRTNRCAQGHEFTPENTTFQPGGRRCRTCHREQGRASYLRRRAAAA